VGDIGRDAGNDAGSGAIGVLRQPTRVTAINKLKVSKGFIGNPAQ
jgi:hypothetical protein